MSDLMVFAEPSPEASPGVGGFWHVLIVDDEESVHQVTKLALNRVLLEGRELRFLDAYSGAEAREVMRHHPEIAMIFLDVIMESETAGLELVDWIRNELNNTLVRIVLRTGQPGAAPEEQIILRYDINDYKEKTELVRSKLFSTTASAVRNYRQLKDLEEAHRTEQKTRQGLERIIQASGNLFESTSLHDFAGGILQQTASLLHFHEDGLMVKANGINAIKEADRFTILATSGRFAGYRDQVPLEVLPWIEMACQEERTIFVEGHFVGYFVSPQKQVDILYLEGVPILGELEEKLINLFGNNIAIAFDRFLSFQRYKESQTHLLRSLASKLDRRKIDSWESNSRLSALARFLGAQLQLDPEEVELIELLAPLHDIGLSLVPDHILHKDGRLSVDERKEIERHPEYGNQFIQGNLEILSTAARIILEHHEHHNGTGYPQGLQGEEISLAARIVGLADTCVALCSHRSYRPAWTPDQALAYVEEHRGTLFDPRLVDVLLGNREEVSRILSD